MKHGTISIDRERCKGCYLCLRACPFKVLEKDDSMNASGSYPAVAAHMEKCTGCASCYRVCPDVVITVYQDEGEGK